MERWQRAFLVLLLALTIGFAGFAGGVALERTRDEDAPIEIDTEARGAGLRTIRDAYDEILGTSVDPPSERALARGAIEGMVKVLKKEADDPYALFYTPQEYESFSELTTGRFSGIGVWLKPKGKRLKVVSVLPDTPAKRGGVLPGDIIVSVDGRDVAEMTNVDAAIESIKGPEGSEVTIEVERDGATRTFELQREQIDLPSLRASMREEEVAYVRLLTFANGAGRDLRDRVGDLIDKGATGVILDMRDNGGGLFDEGIEVASVFIEEGPIVGYKERGAEKTVYEAVGDAFQDIPLVVLVNEGTASASEIVTGALKDRERGVVVGTTTFGKGSVQQIVQLVDGSALKVTKAAYYTPNGSDINGQGIDPDISVEDPGEQRERAFEVLRGIVVSGGSDQS